MDVSSNLNNMRLSPVLVAFLATAATLGLSNSARGQAASSSAKPTSSTAASILPIVELGKSQSSPAASPSAAKNWVVPTAISVPETIAQAQAPSEPATPPAGEQTPQQETPNQIQIGPQPSQPTTPGPSAPQPAPSPESEPATPDQSAPAPEQPTPTPTPATPSQDQTTEPEPRVLVAEVLINGAEGDLQEEIYRVIRTQAGRTTTRSQLQQDINAIFATGYFSKVAAVPTDTPLGVRVTFDVQLNPVLKAVQIEGNVIQSLRLKRADGTEVTLPYQQVVDEIFGEQYGKILNLVQLQEGIKRLNTTYQQNGYVLAQVVDAYRVEPDGRITVQANIAADGSVSLISREGVVENIQVRFIDKDGNECIKDAQGKFTLVNPQTREPVPDKNGNPSKCRNRTRDFIITREFELKPGQVFNRSIAERDLQRVFGLGIFDDVKLSLDPGQDPNKVVVVANVTEKNTGNVAVGAGISSASGLFGTLSYQQQNLGGNNQKLGAELQVGLRDSLLFDLNFTDPWIAGDPFRTSYSVNLFRRRTISLIFDGGEDEVRVINKDDGDRDRPRVVRTGGGISFSRPLTNNIYRRPEWTASLGLQYQRVNITDSDGNTVSEDELGNQLSFSDSGSDDLFTVQLGVVRDLRNDPLRPTSGSLLRLGTEQSIPIGSGSILLNRLRASYSYFIPARFVRFTKGCQKPNPSASDCPQTFAFNIQGGTVLGDLPPYEAFSLGGSNSVRGYDEGDLAAARTYIQATAEYRFPIFSIVSGAVFLDAATDFGSQGDVPGNPGGVRGKPGSGIGYGLGVRIQSPLGPIRIDYGFNDQGDSRLHFGFGERF